MASQPVLSIAIPTFDRAQSLEKCLALLLPSITPHGEKIELLILDNASTDNTPQVVASFLGLVPRGLRVRSIRHESNVGMSENLLACVERSVGRYFMFIGDDDTVDADGLAKVLELLEDGATPSAFIQGSWPAYGVNLPHTASVEPLQALDYFFFAGNSWATISRASFMKRALEDLRKDTRLRGNIWPQTYLIFHSLFTHSDSPPILTSFPLGRMMSGRWIVRPDKKYTIRIVEDLIDVARAIGRWGGSVPPPRQVISNETKRFVDLQLRMIISRAMRDLDSESSLRLAWKLLVFRIRVGPTLKIRVLMSRFPSVLIGVTAIHLFIVGGRPLVRRFFSDLSTQRETYRFELLTSASEGLRVRDFH